VTRSAPPVLHDCYDLSLALYRLVPTFPKAQRFVLGQRIERVSLDLLFHVDAARDPDDREGALQSASRSLDQLRLLVRMATDLGFVPVATHEALVTRFEAIGRQVGGWLRWQPDAPAT